MIIEHTLTDIDSLQSLALKYLGDATRSSEIADYNNLNYPYIVKSKEDTKNYFSQGYITVQRANYQTATIIRQGWSFKTKASVHTGNVSKIFVVTEDTPVAPGIQAANVPLRCTVPGFFGNVAEYTITDIGDDTAELSDIQFLSIYNTEKFVGGRPLDVLVTGDTIYIPVSDGTTPSEDISKLLDALGGEDIYLDTNGDLVIEDGDIGSIYGSSNIEYAINARLSTELGDILQHPDYGSGIQDLVGTANIANKERLIEIAIYRALSQEDRITDTTIKNLVVDGTSIFIDLTCKAAINGTPYSFTFKI